MARWGGQEKNPVLDAFVKNRCLGNDLMGREAAERAGLLPVKLQEAKEGDRANVPATGKA